MYESGSSPNKKARRLRDRRAGCANQRRLANKSPVHITSETAPKSLSEILCLLWQRQEPGWVVIRAYKRGIKRGREQLWARSNEITPRKLERWLKAHRGWYVEFCPTTFERNWEHLDWHLFEWGEIYRRECLSYLEYGPVDRFPHPDYVFDDDKGIWLTDYPSYIDLQARDGLFIWLPKQRLSADELISLYLVPVRRDLKFYNADRSTLMWLIGKKCVRKGMRDPDDIKTVIRASKAYQSRLEEREEPQAERGLEYDVRKLLREAP